MELCLSKYSVISSLMIDSSNFPTTEVRLTGLFFFRESYSAEGGHSAHRVCANHNPTQTLSPCIYLSYAP